MVEAALVTYNHKIIDYSIGKPFSVEFNFERVWHYIKSLGNSYQPYLLNFYHVHPKGLTTYSELDKNCMKGLYQALGYLIHFVIITFESNDLFDIRAKYSAFECHGIENIKKAWIPEYLSDDQILFLKFLAYSVEEL